MKLDRNGRGKYALLKLRRITEIKKELEHSHPIISAIQGALKTLESYNLLDYGDTPYTEFFVMRLKDRFAQAGLMCYGMAASTYGDYEYAQEIEELAKRSGPSHPNCKIPD